MSRECVRRNVFAAAVVVLATAALALAAAPELAIDEQQQSFGISWSPGFAYERVYLNVGGPMGSVLERAFGPNDLLSYDFTDANGLSLPDGDYSYGLLVMRSPSPAEASALEEVEAEAIRLRDEATRLRASAKSAGIENTSSKETNAGEAEADVKRSAAVVDEAEVLAAQHRAMAAEKRIDEVRAELEELNGRFVVRRHGQFSVRGGMVEFESAPRAASQAEGAAEVEGSRDIAVESGGGPVAKWIGDAGNLPEVRFDDIQDEVPTSSWDWRLLGEGGTSDADTNNVFNIMGTQESGFGFDVPIVRLEHDGQSDADSSYNSIVVEWWGDILLGNGTWIFDKSSDGISIGKGSEASEDIEIWDSEPGIRFHDISTPGTYTEFVYNAPWQRFLGNSNQNIAWINATAPANSLAIDSNGEVGLGTTAPVEDLHILTGDTFNFHAIRMGGPTQVWNIQQWSNAIGFRNITRNQNAFWVDNGADFASLIVDDTSYVGIGTPTPTANVHVYGIDGTTQLRVEENSGTAAARTTFWLKNNGGNRFAMQNVDSGSIWQFNALGNFNIDFNGNAGNEFQVQGDGDIIAGGRVFANGGSDVFPDFVFSDEYDLMPLSDLSTFIKANRHLPKVPSAEEIAAQGGVDMTGLQLTLLEKVEELTLHTIRQEERIETLLEEKEGLASRLAELEAKIAAMTN